MGSFIVLDVCGRGRDYEFTICIKCDLCKKLFKVHTNFKEKHYLLILSNLIGIIIRLSFN